jgi:hypothetical protein
MMANQCIRAMASSACLFVTLSAQGVAATDEQLLVGILEEVPGAYVGESSHYGVRVLFRQDGENWRPFPNECGNVNCVASITSQYPAFTRWTVSYEGRPLGTIAARTPSDFKFYSNIGIQDVESGQSPPVIGVPSADYSGFRETPIHRPLIATTNAPQLGPAHAGWTSQPANPADLKKVWPLFSQLVPLIDDCRLDSHGEYIPSNGRAPHRNELEIARKLVNRGGEAIFQARVREIAFKDCDGPSTYRTEFWFFGESTGKIWTLPGQTPGISGAGAGKAERAELAMPLDFVNIRGNGGDVALFLMDGYDAGGYALYYDGFRKVATFTWLYH